MTPDKEPVNQAGPETWADPQVLFLTKCSHNPDPPMLVTVLAEKKDPYSGRQDVRIQLTSGQSIWVSPDELEAYLEGGPAVTVDFSSVEDA